jgi:WD40 repeat protein
VLVAGGTESPAALLWDPATGTLEPAGTLVRPRAGHIATLLPDGRVLLVGGYDLDNPEPLAVAEAEVWDPAERSFTAAGSLARVHDPGTTTVLPDGRVLVIEEASGDGTNPAEVWDPRTGSFEPAGSLSEGHPRHTATLLPDGRVLVIAGMATLPVEIWDPATASFSIVARLDVETGGHTATLLPGGDILLLGGYDARLKWSYDTALITRAPWDSFEHIATLGQARAGHTATLLPDGRVLVVGGSAGRGRRGPALRDEILRSAELWSP